MRYTPENSGVTAPTPRWLLDQVRDRPRTRHYSLRTEQASLSWRRRFILASGKRYPVQMSQAEVETFLTRLAIQAQLSGQAGPSVGGAVVSLPQRIAYRSASRVRRNP
ncbi:phage integrase N-terminal SAM-like domain-containing protein [Xanthomonas citri pv. fuscans]|nr:MULTISPECIES: phage integrase N-terminal SAM-like domain-containing protein [Xanthomonas]MCW3192392.1 phage integrase N-terminal SAM-like domain-containing protein [Xanthomonas citri pv. fuscans]